jgi:LPXTG-motif cell wall-anchored protein
VAKADVKDKRSGGLLAAGVAMLAAAWLILRRARRPS